MCNILPVILRANFADPVDTAKDILEKNMTLFFIPGGELWKQWLAQHDNPDYNGRDNDHTRHLERVYEDDGAWHLGQ